jgi:hypothetical protein
MINQIYMMIMQNNIIIAYFTCYVPAQIANSEGEQNELRKNLWKFMKATERKIYSYFSYLLSRRDIRLRNRKEIFLIISNGDASLNSKFHYHHPFASFMPFSHELRKVERLYMIYFIQFNIKYPSWLHFNWVMEFCLMRYSFSLDYWIFFGP